MKCNKFNIYITDYTLNICIVTSDTKELLSEKISSSGRLRTPSDKLLESTDGEISDSKTQRMTDRAMHVKEVPAIQYRIYINKIFIHKLNK